MRGIIFCTASFAAAYWVSGWVFSGALPGVDQAGVFEISLLCGLSTALASAISWYGILSFAPESRLVGLGVGAMSAQLIYPVLAILSALSVFATGVKEGTVMDANFFGDLVVGSIGFALLAAIASGVFATPIGTVLGFVCTMNSAPKRQAMSA